ncbi:hypothetical protein IT087_01740 [Candidatus Uhrbacteria bacterium]|nr:hypothetical protein [Candidatus Uhrbacteria bacterium]
MLRLERIKKWFGDRLRRSDILILTFKGWNNETRRNLYHDSVGFLLNASPNDRERQQDPSFEDWPKGVLWMDENPNPAFRKMSREEVKTWKREQKGSPLNSIIKVTFLPEVSAMQKKAEILAYLRRIGIEAE